jgi:hypothetical protein
MIVVQTYRTSKMVKWVLVTGVVLERKVQIEITSAPYGRFRGNEIMTETREYSVKGNILTI